MRNNGTLYINDRLVIRRKRPVRYLVMDFDGIFTNLHTEAAYRLFIETSLGFIETPDLRKFLESRLVHGVGSFISMVRLPPGWTIDLLTGNYLLISRSGRVIEARRGTHKLSPTYIAKKYGSKITLEQSLDPDHFKPRYLEYCDGFDLHEGALRAIVASTHGLPRSWLKEIERAIRLAHDNEVGYKKKLIHCPGAFGLEPDNKTQDFMREVKERFHTILLTSSPRPYIDHMLDYLQLGSYFKVKLTGMVKPLCLRQPLSSNLVWKALTDLGARYPDEVLIVGDNRAKDIDPSHEIGFYTALRMREQHIKTVERRLTDIVGIRYVPSNSSMVAQKSFAEIQNGPVQERLRFEHRLEELAIYHYEVYRNAHVMTTKIQNLRPVLFH